MQTIKVMLVDDQVIVREGLRALLESCEDIEIIDEAGNGLEAVTKAKTRIPDIILMDIRMPEMDGVEATRQIKLYNSDIIVIILTTFDEDDYIIKAMTYGASGYLLKDIGREKLIQAIRDSLSGSIILPGAVAAKITNRLVEENKNKHPDGLQRSVPLGIRLEDFKPRELEIIEWLVQGKDNREIAETLFLSLGTVKNYVSQIYMKLEVANRTNAIIALKKIGY
ncbi:MAG: DNA-binding response regulator [Tenericutes bacterium HGW-Tenericutes-2]|jgi:DNA-binding NarL/FixJ family response regulator|nr:MAG: DNA-binding response regulator [Tenericutes bacterium HGW-Tenericutes-2]